MRRPGAAVITRWPPARGQGTELPFDLKARQQLPFEDCNKGRHKECPATCGRTGCCSCTCYCHGMPPKVETRRVPLEWPNTPFKTIEVPLR